MGKTPIPVVPVRRADPLAALPSMRDDLMDFNRERYIKGAIDLAEFERVLGKLLANDLEEWWPS